MTLRPAIAAAAMAALTLVAVAACSSDERSTGATEVSSATTATSSVPTATTTGTTTVSTTTTGPPSTIAAITTTTAPAVFDFPAADSTDRWRVVNDTVMGGVSNGELGWSDGVLTFAGELSLANNGGFASIRSPEIDQQATGEWATRAGVRVDIDGDGRTWTLELRTAGDAGGWITTFPTSPSDPTTVELPWTSFEPVTRFLEPRSTSDALDPARIETVAFFLVDGVEGPYRLGVRSIR